MNRSVVLVAAVVALIAGPRIAAAQGGAPARSTTSAASTWTVPRTPWGDPDLQGLWPSMDMQGTPYERPAQFGERATLACHEGNYAMKHILSGARADEKP